VFSLTSKEGAVDGLITTDKETSAKVSPDIKNITTSQGGTVEKARIPYQQLIKECPTDSTDPCEVYFSTYCHPEKDCRLFVRVRETSLGPEIIEPGRPVSDMVFKGDPIYYGMRVNYTMLKEDHPFVF